MPFQQRYTRTHQTDYDQMQVVTATERLSTARDALHLTKQKLAANIITNNFTMMLTRASC